MKRSRALWARRLIESVRDEGNGAEWDRKSRARLNGEKETCKVRGHVSLCKVGVVRGRPGHPSSLDARRGCITTPWLPLATRSELFTPFQPSIDFP